MRLAVATSTALARAEKLRSRSINPSLVYFDNRLQEHEIKKCVQIIQGDAIDKDQKVKYETVMKDISELLISNKPQLHIMFTPDTEYQAETIPGFFCVPYKFEPLKLKAFVQVNMDKCRTHTQKYL